MPTEPPRGNPRTGASLPVARMPFLDVVAPRADRALRVWAQYLEALLHGAELAVTLAEPAPLERAQRDLVWFLRSTPADAAELDRHANLAIEEIHAAGPAAAARLREIAVAVRMLVRAVVETQRGAR